MNTETQALQRVEPSESEFGEQLTSWGRGLTESNEYDAWLLVARRILNGDYDEADNSTIQSLTIGLRSIHHPLALAALARLPDNKEKP